MANSAMPENNGKNLIPLTDNDGAQAVMGRDLHAFLEVGTAYSRWIERLIEKYGFVTGQDFMPKMAESTGGRPSEDHILTLDMAKELSMVQNNERGRQARRYFLECERVAREHAQMADNAKSVIQQMTRSEILQIALNAETERLQLEAKNKELEPKAEAYDEFMDATGHYNVGTVAKMLGKSQNWLFRELRNRGVLISKGAMKNTPYQQYMHHFEVKAHYYERSNGEQGVSHTTYVQPSGIDFIRRKLGLPTIDPLPIDPAA
ncbi:phage antirepressor KilAC domain-containing protein [Corynebacterium phoceense]|uniref:phage antirepressor KilAC domain-containing protein n=1 Tax=Corynebacterium phoceense TaxID=1686286 RepID=UPI0018AA9974|nr:phage antirepressor KilAC domain-containing protein [Corynebacterium phoceense]MBF9011317.1 phage antirepressor KilAC domain-containing protein [Corynebacterium phoceense]